MKRVNIGIRNKRSSYRSANEKEYFLLAIVMFGRMKITHIAVVAYRLYSPGKHCMDPEILASKLQIGLWHL